MERAFIVTKNSDYYKALNDYLKHDEINRSFIKHFFEEAGIESTQYCLKKDGFNQSDIYLGIIPTKNDEVKFGEILNKPTSERLRYFKKRSKFLKDFQQKCMDNKIKIINHEPNLRNYFQSLDLCSFSYCHIPCEEGYYLQLESKVLKEDDVPKGMIPIKMSEFYKYKEEYKEREINNGEFI